jgi:speckle-type POZ protein
MYNTVVKSSSSLSLASNESTSPGPTNSNFLPIIRNDYSLDSVCCTKRTLHTFSHMWIVENFSSYLEDPEPIICLSSSPFSPISGVSVATQWRLVCYPKGNYGASSNYMSIFLEYIKGERDIKAKAEYSLVNRKCELTEMRKDAQFSVYKCGNSRGFINYVKYDTLTLLENDTLDDDKLKIYVRITIMDDAITEETKYQEFDDAESVNFTTRGLEGLVRDFTQLLLHSPQKMSDIKIKVKGSSSSHNTDTTESDDDSNSSDVIINAHKLILAARSPVFAAMFSSRTLENTTNTIEINDLRPETIQSMLEYIYTGKVNDIKKSTVELYRCADKYQLEDLRSQAEMALMNSISIDTSAEILLLADQHHSKELKSRVIQFIVSGNLKAITQTEGWHKYVACIPDLVTEVIQATAFE